MPTSRCVLGPAVLALLGLLLFALAGPAAAQVTEIRQGEENPVVSIFKSTIYGGLAGLVLGGAIELIDDDDSNTDELKWGFVAGTFFGFGFGVYHVLTRPEPYGAFLEGGEQGWAFHWPQPALAIESGAPPLLAPQACRLSNGSVAEVRTTLLAYCF
jgi:hypothetical protein